jgi:hypothetical protein
MQLAVCYKQTFAVNISSIRDERRQLFFLPVAVVSVRHGDNYVHHLI